MIAVNATIFPWLAGALALSLAGNAALGWAYLGQRDKTAAQAEKVKAAIIERDGARQGLNACNDALDDLHELAGKREKAAAPARAAAAATAAQHNQRADAVLAKPPAVPGDACASAQALVDDWLKERGK